MATKNNLHKAIIKRLAHAPTVALEQLAQEQPESADDIKRIAHAIGLDVNIATSESDSTTK